jgi:hypothetical protein
LGYFNYGPGKFQFSLGKKSQLHIICQPQKAERCNSLTHSKGSGATPLQIKKKEKVLQVSAYTFQNIFLSLARVPLSRRWLLQKANILPHSVPKGPKSGHASLKTRKGRASSKPREGLVQGLPKFKKGPLV